MGRPTWGTEPQLTFLDSFVPGLDAAKATCGLQTEYACISKLFLEKWPTKPTEKEENATSDPAQRQALADDRRRMVSHVLHFFRNTH